MSAPKIATKFMSGSDAEGITLHGACCQPHSFTTHVQLQTSVSMTASGPGGSRCPSEFFPHGIDCACMLSAQVSSPSGVRRGSVRLAGDRIFHNIGVSNDGRLAFLTIDRCRAGCSPSAI
jgi:hypothetical protein